MPDLVTHFAAAYFLKRPRRWSDFRVPFYLGAILPDILTRPLYIVYPPSNELIYSLHTPLAVILISILISSFVIPSQRSGVRLNLLLGAGTHFGLDLLQKSVTGSYHWFFPFSLKTFEWGLIWADDSVRLVPLWVVLVFTAEAFSLLKKKKSKQRIVPFA
jgi:hypothetical protein